MSGSVYALERAMDYICAYFDVDHILSHFTFRAWISRHIQTQMQLKALPIRRPSCAYRI